MWTGPSGSLPQQHWKQTSQVKQGNWVRKQQQQLTDRNTKQHTANQVSIEKKLLWFRLQWGTYSRTWPEDPSFLTSACPNIPGRTSQHVVTETFCTESQNFLKYFLKLNPKNIIKSVFDFWGLVCLYNTTGSAPSCSQFLKLVSASWGKMLKKYFMKSFKVTGSVLSEKVSSLKLWCVLIRRISRWTGNHQKVTPCCPLLEAASNNTQS